MTSAAQKKIAVPRRGRKCDVLAGGVPEHNFEFPAPAFDLPWMTL